MGDQEEISPEDIDPEALEYAHELQSLAKEIADNEDMAKQLKSILETVANESVREERDYLLLTDQIRGFAESLGVTAPFSVSRTKAVINILLLMWNHTSVARYVMKSVYNVEIATTVDEMLEQFPSDLKQLDERSAEIFAKALKDGYEQVKNIRLMVVGMFGVGKTSLVNNLIKDLRDENIIPLSTEGIDLKRCQLMSNGDWHLDKEQKQAKYKSRFKLALMDAIKNIPSVPRNIQTVPEREHDEGESEERNTVIDKPLDRLKEIAEKVQVHKDDDDIKEYFKLAKEEPKIEIPVTVPAPVITNTDVTVSVWDFAGQTLYYSTHQFFLNRRSIYLVLMDMTKDLDEYVKEEERSGTWCGLVKDCTYLVVFKFWLNAIHMYSGYRSMAGEIKPTVILVGTRKDKMLGTDEEKDTRCDKYFERALGSFKGSPILKHIYHRKFLVNNKSPTDNVFDEIRNEILHLAEKQDYWGENYPVRWIQMEQSLDKMRDKGKQVLKLEEIEEINDANKVHPLGKKNLELFLEIQHRHGNILYFNTEKLRHLVVLAPQWIIDVFKCFITHLRYKDPKLIEHWKIYEDLAILKPEVFHEIMDNSRPDIKDNKENVMKYMEYLDVMAKPLVLDETDKAKDLIGQATTDVVEPLNVKFLDFHIVPCRLKNPPPPISQFTSPGHRKKTPVLCFVFVENFMPPSFFHRLVAVCIRTWPISKEGGKDLLYNGLAVFDIGPTDFLTIWFKDHIIYARISSITSNAITDLDFELCQKVRLLLRRSLLNFVGQSLENPRTPTAFEEYIQCPKMQDPLKEGMFRVAAFMYDRELTCTECRCRHPVEREEALNYWYKQKLDGLDNDDDSNKPAVESDLLEVAKEIGEKEYWMLGIQLGFDDAQMNKLYDVKECRKDHRTFVFKYMVTWMKREGEKATQQRLNRAIRAARVNL
ncbi:uncharacterized protein LOC127862252 [Dreissena polymorpha]|uniref:non-specific serine/threonine protein kinase n=1 Tax=Dreissena polymorpha TaxID=45954 RepID=A0A9D3Y9C8_DREPO|nr:uncharacterized protein LOC127862252 [Dreissena polymorpha]XP_052257266.1 uncharacterized protein LOC127862252 [Dreissena polymorpha]KAH3695990.1 hypothetical protein DPMN_083451 [Dreissena polymorpha]